MKKRILPLLLALVMTVALVPAVAFAAPETASGGGLILNAVTDAWSPLSINDEMYTSFDADKKSISFSVNAYNRDSIIVCMEMEPGTVLRDTRVFLNKFAVPIRYAVAGDCSYYDEVKTESLFGNKETKLYDFNLKSIVIPTWVLALGKSVTTDDGQFTGTLSTGTIELWDAEGNVVVYTLNFYTVFEEIMTSLPTVYPFDTTINATDVNIRADAGITYKSLGKFAIGETVTVLAIEGNWAAVIRAGSEDIVCVHVAYLNLPYEGPIAGTMLRASTLYAAATSVGEKLTKLPGGTAVTLLAREGTFFMVQVGEVIGYVYGPDVQTW